VTAHRLFLPPEIAAVLPERPYVLVAGRSGFQRDDTVLLVSLDDDRCAVYQHVPITHVQYGWPLPEDVIIISVALGLPEPWTEAVDVADVCAEILAENGWAPKVPEDEPEPPVETSRLRRFLTGWRT
jgi:hypothetical protein